MPATKGRTKKVVKKTSRKNTKSKVAKIETPEIGTPKQLRDKLSTRLKGVASYILKVSSKGARKALEDYTQCVVERVGMVQASAQVAARCFISLMEDVKPTKTKTFEELFKAQEKLVKAAAKQIETVAEIKGTTFGQVWSYVSKIHLHGHDQVIEALVQGKHVANLRKIYQQCLDSEKEGFSQPTKMEQATSYAKAVANKVAKMTIPQQRAVFAVLVQNETLRAGIRAALQNRTEKKAA